MMNSQRALRLFLVLLFLIAGYSIQSSLLRVNCTQDLACWYRNIPGLVKIINPWDILKHRDQMNDLITKADSISQYKDIELSLTFSKGELTVSGLTGLLGEPEKVYTVNCAGAGILYPDKGVEARLYPEAYFVGVKSSQSIQSLTLMRPDILQRDDFATDIVISEWRGFINYCD
jgi:hypothetical protein